MFREPFDLSEFETLAEKLLSDISLNRALMDSLPYPALLIRNDRRIVAANSAAKTMGVEVGTYCWDTFGKKASISEKDREYYEKNNSVPPQGIKCIFCKADEALSSKKSTNEMIPADNIIYDTFWIPLTEDVYLHYAIIQEK